MRTVSIFTPFFIYFYPFSVEIIEIPANLIKNYFFGLPVRARLKIIYFYPFFIEVLQNLEKIETVVEHTFWGWSALVDIKTQGGALWPLQ